MKPFPIELMEQLPKVGFDVKEVIGGMSQVVETLANKEGIFFLVQGMQSENLFKTAMVIW